MATRGAQGKAALYANQLRPPTPLRIFSRGAVAELAHNCPGEGKSQNLIEANFFIFLNENKNFELYTAIAVYTKPDFFFF